MSEPRKLSDDERWAAAKALVSRMHARTRPPTGTRIRKSDDGPPMPSTVPASQVGPSYQRYFGQHALGGDTFDALLKKLAPLERTDPQRASVIKAEMAAALLNARIGAVRRASDPAAAASAIRKAKAASSNLVPVYDAGGKLVGLCEKADVQPLGSVDVPSSDATKPRPSAVPPLPPPVSDLSPAPSGAAGVPAGAVSKRR
jgi:hypothetical protein